MDLADFERTHAKEIETEFIKRLTERIDMLTLIQSNQEVYNEVLSELAEEYEVSD